MIKDGGQSHVKLGAVVKCDQMENVILSIKLTMAAGNVQMG